MRNDYAIYLHDTPAQHLFESAQRHRSHGCVRVEDAAGFARILAEQDGSILQFEEALANGGEESFVALSSEIPVRLIYHTAYQTGRASCRVRVGRAVESLGVAG